MGEYKPFSLRNSRRIAREWGIGVEQNEEQAKPHLFLQEVQEVQDDLREQNIPILQHPQSIDPIEYTGGFLVPHAARSGGVVIFAPTRFGKSRTIGRGVCFTDLEQGIASVVIDAKGEAISNLIDKILYIKDPKKQNELWDRIIYCRMAGEQINGETYVPVFPMLERRGQESLYDVSQRYINLIQATEKNFASAAIQGLERFANILTNLQLALAAYELPISEVFSILDNPEAWKEKFTRLKDHPEVREAVMELEQQLAVDKRFRDQIFEPLRNRLSFLRQDLVSRAMFTGEKATFDWEKAITEGKTILLDYSGVKLDSRIGRVQLFWVWESLLEHARGRTRNSPPLSLVIDELAAFVRGTGLNRDRITDDFIELITVLKGNGNIFPTFATQNQEFLPDDMRAVCLLIASKLFGAVNDLEIARELANRWYPNNPTLVKYWRNVWAAVESEGGYKGGPRVTTHRIIDYDPIFYSFEEQTDGQSRKFIDQDTGHGLFAQAQYEGHMPAELLPITVNTLDPGQWVNEGLVETARKRLMKRDGVRVSVEQQSLQPVTDQQSFTQKKQPLHDPVEERASKQAKEARKQARDARNRASSQTTLGSGKRSNTQYNVRRDRPNNP